MKSQVKVEEAPSLGRVVGQGQGQLGKMVPPLNLLPPMFLDRVLGFLMAGGLRELPGLPSPCGPQWDQDSSW